MKNIIYILTIVLLFISNTISAQILTQGNISSSITNSNVLIDGSSNYSIEAGAGANVGKGIVIPSVDLVNFAFDLTLADGFTFPTYFDGMIVYNNTGGTTLTTGNRSSTPTAVLPGFYYFSTPNGSINGNVTSGEWKALGGGKVNVTTSETESSTKVGGANVYAIKGTFTMASSATNATITIPAGLTDIYRVSVYKGGTATPVTVSGLNKTSGLLLFGGTGYYSVIPAGTYDYVLEYFK